MGMHSDQEYGENNMMLHEISNRDKGAEKRSNVIFLIYMQN